MSVNRFAALSGVDSDEDQTLPRQPNSKLSSQPDAPQKTKKKRIRRKDRLKEQKKEKVEEVEEAPREYNPASSIFTEPEEIPTETVVQQKTVNIPEKYRIDNGLEGEEPNAYVAPAKSPEQPQYSIEMISFKTIREEENNNIKDRRNFRNQFRGADSHKFDVYHPDSPEQPKQSTQQVKQSAQQPRKQTTEPNQPHRQRQNPSNPQWNPQKDPTSRQAIHYGNTQNRSQGNTLRNSQRKSPRNSQNYQNNDKSSQKPRQKRSKFIYNGNLQLDEENFPEL